MTRLICLCLFSIGVFFAAQADACMPAPKSGQYVTVTDEAAIIVWDAETKVEHFIRRATFSTDATDMGFIVPTPGKPELEAVDNSVFELLERQTAARIIAKSKGRGGLGCGSAAPGAAMVEVSAGRVDVVEVKEVAGQKATVLSATDAVALRKWLESNDYPVSEAMEEWAKYYVEKKWFFTAFKFTKNMKADGLTAAAVKMSFPTETPIYPYKEPATKTAKAGASRTLKVFLLASVKMEDTFKDTKKGWAGQTEYAKPIGVSSAQPWFSLLKLGDAPNKLWLTEMVDRSNPRLVSHDIKFQEAADQDEKERAPIYVDAGNGSRSFASLGLLCMAGLGLWFVGRRR